MKMRSVTFQEASDPKSVKCYDTGHALNDEARRDRAQWVQKQMGWAS
jgi:hypothetical protein